MNEQTHAYYLGIDGGGSKTLAVLVDAQGRELGRGLAGSANYNAVGIEQAVQNIASAVTYATQAIDNTNHIHKAWLGLAGVDRPTDFATLYPRLQSLAHQVYITNDAELNLGALPSAIGITLIAGTGSIVLGRNTQGELARAGGWGHLLGDEGSGYDLGHQSLLAAVKAADGRGPQTRLLDLVLENWHLQKAEEIIGQVYAGNSDKARIARLSACVFQAARQGDEIAHTIILQGAAELALAVSTVAKKLGFAPEQEIALALGGGLLLNEANYREQFFLQLRTRQAVGEIAYVDQPAVSAAQAIIHLDF